jgi:hypothetical protein
VLSVDVNVVRQVLYVLVSTYQYTPHTRISSVEAQLAFRQWGHRQPSTTDIPCTHSTIPRELNRAQPATSLSTISIMASENNPFAMLVYAANAQSQTEDENQQAPSASTGALQQPPQTAKQQMFTAAEAEGQQQNYSEMQWREAIQREAYEREAHEREALQRRAALMTQGFGGFQGFQGFAQGQGQGPPPQEAEYLQQLRLEALVQQRRQETLAQLAIAQEFGMSQDLQSLINAQQLRQAGLMRQDQMFGGGGMQHYADQVAALGGRMGVPDENMLLQQYLEEQRQQKMAAFASVASMGGHYPGAEAKHGPELVGSAYGDAAVEAETRSDPIRDESKTTVLPCRARGMPMDHNVKVGQ